MECNSVPLAMAQLPASPLVSVLIANYNYAGYVSDAIQSVLRQTYGRFEVVVCDDGSTDDSVEVVGRLARSDDRIRLIRKSNGGQASAWNAALRASKGEVICLLDSDDRFDERKLEMAVDYFTTTGYGALVHPLLVIDDEGNPLQRLPVGQPFEEGWIRDRVVRRGGRWSVVAGGGVCFRREVAALIFPVPEDVFVSSDADAFVFQLLPLLTTVGFIDEVLYYYRLHDTNEGLARSLRRESVERRLNFLNRTVGSVNARLSALGFDGFQLDMSRNLGAREQLFYLELFNRSATRLRLFSEYRSLFPLIVSDDLYRFGRKAGLLFLWGVAILLPSGWRPRWISGFRGLVYGPFFRLRIFFTRRSRGLHDSKLRRR